MKIILALVVILASVAGVTAPDAQQTAPVICNAADLDVTVAGEWTEGQSMPTPRSELGAAALDSIIYIAGGLTSDGISDVFEGYNMETEAWTTLAPLPVGLHHFGITALDDRIYVSGGYSDMQFTPDARAWMYDPEADEWTPLNALPEAIGAHQMVNVDDILYIVGGVPHGTTLWAYEAEADSWDTSLAPMPTAREHLGATAVDNHLIVVGGRWSEGNLAVVEAYAPETNEWEALPEMPTARGGFNIAAVDGRIYAAGGEAFVDEGCTFNRAEVYDVETHTWARLPDMPTPRHGLTMAGIDGRWLIIGGATGAGQMTYETTSDRVEIFTPAEAE
jgi:N-acetylneuraminic acid mutarotase